MNIVKRGQFLVIYLLLFDTDRVIKVNYGKDLSQALEIW